MSAAAKPLDEVRAGIPAGVARIVMQALARNADERPTAEQLVAGLAVDPPETAAGIEKPEDSEPRMKLFVVGVSVLVALVLATLLLR